MAGAFRQIRVTHHMPDKSFSQREGARILTELRYGRGLNEEDVATVCDIIKSSERQAVRATIICFSVLAILVLVVYAVKWIAGWDNKNVNAVLFFLPFVALAVMIFTRENSLRHAIELKLRCRGCNKAIRGIELMKVRDTHRCPRCSTSDPLAAKAVRT